MLTYAVSGHPRRRHSQMEPTQHVMSIEFSIISTSIDMNRSIVIIIIIITSSSSSV